MNGLRPCLQVLLKIRAAVDLVRRIHVGWESGVLSHVRGNYRRRRRRVNRTSTRLIEIGESHNLRAVGNEIGKVARNDSKRLDPVLKQNLIISQVAITSVKSERALESRR